MIDSRWIRTIAGTGVKGRSGDGGPATAALLACPSAVALDTAGNLYIADAKNHVIRRVDTITGFITTVAGNVIGGASGDGGPATAAQLALPHGIALDDAGNLYIADMYTDQIRRVDAVTGVITTVAGTGIEGYSGDGGPATAAELNSPQGVTLDGAGNLYISDGDNHVIRRVDAVSGIITTVAGTGVQGFSGDGGPATAAQLFWPNAMAFDDADNLYIAEGDQVRRVDAVSGIITTVAGTGVQGFSGDGGPATAAQLNSPQGMALDHIGNLYIADKANNRVRRFRVG